MKFSEVFAFLKITIMTRLQVCSDLHLEHFCNNNSNVIEIFSALLKPCAPLLILTGDVAKICSTIHLDTFEIYQQFLAYCSSRWEQVVLVPGNHEYYNDRGVSMTLLFTTLKYWCDMYDNITLLDNQSVIIDGVCYWGGTLWSYLPPHVVQTNPLYNDNGLLSNQDYNNLHFEALRSLKSCIDWCEAENIKCIVCSHYAPTFSHYTSKAKLSTARKYFYASNLEYLCVPTIPFWICGHTHINCFQQIPNTPTFLVCNSDPRKSTYNNKFILDIKSTDELSSDRSKSQDGLAPTSLKPKDANRTTKYNESHKKVIHRGSDDSLLNFCWSVNTDLMLIHEG